MNKYIDSEKLIAEITQREYEVFPTNDGKVRACSTPDQIQSGWLNALKWVRETITSLQQEQPEVDLEKEAKRWWKEHLHLNPENKLWMDAHQSVVFARHFYELGLNARKEE